MTSIATMIKLRYECNGLDMSYPLTVNRLPGLGRMVHRSSDHKPAATLCIEDGHVRSNVSCFTAMAAHPPSTGMERFVGNVEVGETQPFTCSLSRAT